MRPSLPSPPAPSLESKVAFLRHPASYPDPTYRVEAIETHMSWVFLTDGFAYKLKKPVRHEFLDFRTSAARHFYCEEEVRLNRRLAPDTYLATIALSIDALGHIRFGADGAIVDWLIKMRRLPAQHMLDYAILHGDVSPDTMHRIAARLAAFYRTCPAIDIDAISYRARFRREIDGNQRELSRPAYRLPRSSIVESSRAQRTFLNENAALFDARIASGKIVEGHGDLRPEHVCIKPDILVIDCLEFSRALRMSDPIDEVGFLALECERLGAAKAGAILLQTYCELADDRPDPMLVQFYQSYRASLRAKITIRHLEEEKFRYSAAWRRRAEAYLELAIRHQVCIKSVIEPPV